MSRARETHLPLAFVRYFCRGGLVKKMPCLFQLLGGKDIRREERHGSIGRTRRFICSVSGIRKRGVQAGRVDAQEVPEQSGRDSIVALQVEVSLGAVVVFQPDLRVVARPDMTTGTLLWRTLPVDQSWKGSDHTLAIFLPRGYGVMDSALA